MLQRDSNAATNRLKRLRAWFLQTTVMWLFRDVVVHPRRYGEHYSTMPGSMVHVWFIHDRYHKPNCFQLIFHLAGGNVHQALCGRSHLRMSLKKDGSGSWESCKNWSAAITEQMILRSIENFRKLEKARKLQASRKWSYWQISQRWRYQKDCSQAVPATRGDNGVCSNIGCRIKGIEQKAHYRQNYPASRACRHDAETQKSEIDIRGIQTCE